MICTILHPVHISRVLTSSMLLRFPALLTVISSGAFASFGACCKTPRRLMTRSILVHSDTSSLAVRFRPRWCTIRNSCPPRALLVGSVTQAMSAHIWKPAQLYCQSSATRLDGGREEHWEMSPTLVIIGSLLSSMGSYQCQSGGYKYEAR